MEASYQSRDRRGEEGERFDPHPQLLAESGLVHRESCRCGWPFPKPLSWGYAINRQLHENTQSAQSMYLLPRCENEVHNALLLLSPLSAFCSVSQELMCILKGYVIIIGEPIWDGLLAPKSHLATTDWPRVDPLTQTESFSFCPHHSVTCKQTIFV